MKWVEEFRTSDLAGNIAKSLKRTVRGDREYHFMEFCGGHTHTLFRYGIPDLLPANLFMHHGPGCPVCVLPMTRMDMAIKLAMKQGVILCSYGDMLRVPGSDHNSLLKAKARGADIRVIYSPADAIEIARKNPSCEVVFFAIGFETTTPPTAVVLQQARRLKLNNFSVFCNHVLTPPAIEAILHPAVTSPENSTLSPVHLDGLVGPGHVSVITGSALYEAVAERYNMPIVIAGFEPVDLLHAILMLVERVNASKPGVAVQYKRAVNRNGNVKAQALMKAALDLRETFEWRGFGEIPCSAVKIRSEFADWDAEARFDLTVERKGTDNKACLCPEVLRGQVRPPECKLFGKQCHPDNPVGACMVSSEGACAAYYHYGDQART